MERIYRKEGKGKEGQGREGKGWGSEGKERKEEWKG